LNLDAIGHILTPSTREEPSVTQVPAAHPRNHNLPALLSTFIGRKRDIAEVRQLLRTERLVTLTGPGGCGKTRLALQVAAETLPAFVDGVWLIELASLSDGALIPQAVAATLDLREQGGRALLDTLADYLRARQTLLVLDNCEHIIQACAQVAESFLQACPSLTILATSREPLRIPGEVVHNVPPLALPETKGRDGPRELRRAEDVSEAEQLFIARARAAVPGFDPSDENAAAVADICVHLDGMPLAIELAAARVRSLSVQQVAGLLGDRFRLLTGGDRTAPARHRTLEATLDWSYALLSETERHVLQAISVFAGGCTLQAAEAVCAQDGLPASAVLDHLSHLADKSLILADTASGEARFRMLETIREYALKSLIAAGNESAVRNRHLQHFLRWAEAAAPLLRLEQQSPWINRFEMEHDNLRAAIEWSQREADRGQAGLRLAAACGEFWRLRYHSEGRMRLAAVLANPAAQHPTTARATALHQLAVLSFFQSDYAAVRKLEREGLDIWRTTGASGRQGVAAALEMLAEAESETGNFPSAFPLYEESLVIFREVGDLEGEGDTLKMLGWSAMRVGDLDQADLSLRQALEICRRSGSPHAIASALCGLGELAIRRGEYARAVPLLHEGLEVAQGMGDRWTIPIALGSLGWVALQQRNYRKMADFLRESLSMRLINGDRGGMAWCLEKLAQAAVQRRQPERAATLLGAAAALRSPVHSGIDPIDRPEYDRMVSDIQATLGDQAFEAGRLAGERMQIEEMVHSALRGLEMTPAESARLEKEQYSGLTARELEVAVLIARGRSNREIAAAMTVGVRTVETYATRILGKLGFDSRVQIATWAIEKGLVSQPRTE
jgi:non-specific serine/threonine protein kinase